MIDAYLDGDARVSIDTLRNFIKRHRSYTVYLTLPDEYNNTHIQHVLWRVFKPQYPPQEEMAKRARAFVEFFLNEVFPNLSQEQQRRTLLDADDNDLTLSLKGASCGAPEIARTIFDKYRDATEKGIVSMKEYADLLIHRNKNDFNPLFSAFVLRDQTQLALVLGEYAWVWQRVDDDLKEELAAVVATKRNRADVMDGATDFGEGKPAPFLDIVTCCQTITPEWLAARMCGNDHIFPLVHSTILRNNLPLLKAICGFMEEYMPTTYKEVLGMSAGRNAGNIFHVLARYNADAAGRYTVDAEIFLFLEQEVLKVWGEQGNEKMAEFLTQRDNRHLMPLLPPGQVRPDHLQRREPWTR